MGARANEIVKDLWIGDMHAAVDPEFFKKYNIKAVVNVTPDVEMPFKNLGVEYLHLNIDDSLKKKDIDKMIFYLPMAVEFIKKKRAEGKNVLVNCHMGYQRSACVVVAYLSIHHKMTIKEAVALVLKRRPVAFHHGSNINFLESLMFYAE